MKKYLAIAACELKGALAYPGSAWLAALSRLFPVMLCYLLWKAVYQGADSLEGFTLPEMTVYYLLGIFLSPLTQSEGLLSDYAEDIKTGRYAKYMLRPVSPLGYFIAGGYARALLPVVTGLAVLLPALVLFPAYFAPIAWGDALIALPFLLLGGLMNMLICYLIAMMTFRLTDVGFVYMLMNIIQSFLAGRLLPLNLVFGDAAARLSPFSYTFYEPVMRLMGKSANEPWTGLLILCLWIVLLGALALWVGRRAPRRFEGVGI